MPDSTISVTHFLGGFKFGGIERLVMDLLTSQLNNAGINASILVLNDKGDFADDFYNLKIPITGVNANSTYWMSLKKMKLIWKAIRKSEIIHFHSFHIYVGLIAIIFRKKIVYTEHGNFAFGRKKRVADKVNHFLRKIFFIYAADRVICNSNFTKKQLNKNWSISVKKLTIINNGASLENPTNKISSKVSLLKKKYENNFVIGTLSRLASVKRIDRLINAFSRFSDDKTDVKLLIVGDGPEKNNIQDLIDSKNLNEKVELAGYKSNVFDYYSVFDVFVLPSQNESFGLVVLEAYSLSIPVLIFKDAGGPVDIVSKYNKNDISKDIDDMVISLNDYYYKKVTGSNLQDLLNYFSADRMEQEYFREYKNLLCAE